MNRGANEFRHEVFLSHSAADKVRVRQLAERLRADGLKVRFDEWVLTPGDSIPAKIDPPSLQSYGGARDALEHSRLLACPAEAPARRRMLCLSAQAFGSDWAQLACPAAARERRRKAGTCGRRNLRFRGPLNLGHKTCYERNANPDFAWSSRS